MKHSGVTLLELMVALAIVAILLAIGIPTFTSLVRSSRLSSATNELVSSLFFARGEAIKRSSRAVICPSATGSSCAGSGDWHQGWIVFGDDNNNASVDAGETVILKRAGLPDGMWLKGNSPVSEYISYTASGGAKLVSGAFQAGTLTLCNVMDAPGAARQIIVSSTGRPRTVKLTLTSCP
ncbi:MAG: GspH/FimT family pseudopilin [Thiobacillus sp.]